MTIIFTCCCLNEIFLILCCTATIIRLCCTAQINQHLYIKVNQMTKEAMKQWTDLSKWQDSLKPVVAFNELALKNTEKLAKMQIASLESFTKVVLENWKAGLAVKDSESLQEFAGAQQTHAQEVAKKVAANAKEIMEIGNGYTTQARKIIEGNVAELTKKAA